MLPFVFRSLAAAAAFTLAAHGAGQAQTAALAPGQVSGAELQAWLQEDGLALGGVSLRNGCHFLARNRADARPGAEPFVRYVSGFCPMDMAPWTVKGEGKVVGDRWCSKFVWPDGTASDQCNEIVKIGDNKFETRRDGQPLEHFYRLVR